MSLMRIYLSVLLSLTLGTCLYGLDSIFVEVKTGDAPTEITWTLKDVNGQILYSDEGLITEPNFSYAYQLEVDTDSCVLFEIMDSGENGIGAGGYYAIRRGNFWYANFVNNFGAYNSHIMGDCEEGLTCENPMPINSIAMYHPGTKNYWYTITPERSAFYNISTCFNRDLNNEDLDTRMLIYDTCPAQILNTPEGALAFSDNFCASGAGFESLRLEEGIQYFIRVDILDDSPQEVIAVQILFTTENLGCMDPASCTYNPLANTDDGSCEYEAGCGPDLAIGRETFVNSLRLDKYEVEDSCLLAEECVTGLGVRDVVRFTTAIFNIGNADYVVGYPDTNSGGFSNDNCHAHWHQLGYAEYILYSGAGQPEPIGFKNGFCVLDIGCDSKNTKYTCAYMGITAGCYDEYDADIACQWIDLTDVEDGDYTMVARINWGKFPDARGLHELDYENNWAQVCINLDRSSGSLELTVLDTCEDYRDCYGVAFGPAIEDCNGDCGGMAHFGDIDLDQEISTSDVDTYLSEIGNGVVTATSCSDLDGNGVLTVYDACLLEECLSDYDGTEPWHQHCLFPGGIENTSLQATLTLMEVDIAEQSIIIGYESLQSNVRAFQFRLSGIDEITKVEDLTGTNMRPSWSMELDVLAIAGNLPSGPESELVKVYYKNQIDNEICLSEVIDIVNTSYQKVLGETSADNCFFYSNVDNHYRPQGITLHPNPVTDKVYIDTKGRQGVIMQMYSIGGKLLREVELSPRHELDVSDCEAGLYFAKFSDGTTDLFHIVTH